MIFSKRIELGYDLFCTIWKGGIFSQKHGIFSRTENERERVRESEREREDFPQEIHGSMVFSI